MKTTALALLRQAKMKLEGKHYIEARCLLIEALQILELGIHASVLIERKSPVSSPSPRTLGSGDS